MGDSILGGSGLWSAAGQNWWTGSAAVAFPAAGVSNIASFGGVSGTVNLDTSAALNGMMFSSSGYVIAGAQVLTLNGTAPFINASGSSVSATLGNSTSLVLSGSAGLTKTGTGTVALNGSAPHSFTGGLNVAGGTLLLSLANLENPIDLIPSSNTLTMGTGTITVTGKVGAPATQSFANTVLNKGNAQFRVGPPTGGAATTLNLGAITRPTPGSVARFNTAAGGFGTGASATERLFVSGVSNGAWFAPWAFTGDHNSTTLRWAYTDTTTGQIRQQAGVSATATNVTSPTTVYTANNIFTPTVPVVALGLQSNASSTYNLNGVSATIGGFISIPANTATTFNTTGGGFIQINSSNEFFTAGIGSAIINVPIVGNAGQPSHVTHVGGGNLFLGATNTYTGQTNVIGGVLTVTETGTINQSSGVHVLPGGTFRQNNFTTPLTAPVSLLGGKMDGYGNAGTVTVSNSTDNVLANLTNSPAPLGIDNLVFQGAATIAPKLGSTVVAGSPIPNLPLAINNLTTTPTVGKVVIAPISPTGGWLDGSNTYDVLTYTNWNGNLSDFVLGTASPAFAARQSGTLFVDGNTIKLTVAGDKALWTGVASGNWTTTPIGSPYNWRTQTGGVDTEFIMNDEVVFDDSATITNVNIVNSNISLANLFINNETKDYSIASVDGFGITAVGNFVKTGAATLTLGGVNTYTGTTRISEGTLKVGSATAFQGTSSLFLGSNELTNTASATLDLNGNSARFINITGGSQTLNTVVNSGSGQGTDTLTIVAPGGAIIAEIKDGPTRKTAVALGAATGNLTNPANTFSGGYQMFGPSGGGAANGVRHSPSAVNNPIVVAGVLTSGTYGTGTITIGLDAADRSQFYFNSPGVILANNIVVNTALGSDIAGAFRAEDHSLLVTGQVVANKASVVVHHNGQFSGGPTAGGPNATDVTGGEITFTGPIVAGENPAAGLTAQQANLSTTKRLIVRLANTTSTPNNYTGNTVLTAANVRLQLGAPEQIPHGAGFGNVISTGSTLDLNDFSETINGLSGSGFVENIFGTSPVTLTMGAGDADGLTYSGVIFDARRGAKLSVTKVGAGAQTLSGANQYTGVTTVADGTLQIGSGGETGSLRPESSIVTNGTLAFNRSNSLVQGVDFAGNITGTGGLTKLGSGDLVLNTANAYAGATHIGEGTLTLTGAGTLGSGMLTLANGGVLNATESSAGALALAGGLGGSGSVNGTGKAVVIGGSFSPLALSMSGNVSLAANTTTTLVAGASLNSTSVTTVVGSLLNGGALNIVAGEGVVYADGQTYNFFSASEGVSPGFSAVSVGTVALAEQTSGVWTGSSAGLSYTYNESTGSLSVAAASVPLTALETWRQQYFQSPLNADEGANDQDPDGDGIVNLLEYAFGGDPLTSSVAPKPVVSGGNPLSITFNRVSDGTITYVVEASGDLSSWSEIFTSTGVGGQITVQDPGPVTGNRRFLRVKVTAQ